MIAVLLGLGSAPLATSKEAEVPLTPQGEKLLATYTEILDSLKAEITAAAPAIDERKKAAFLTGHASVGNIPAPPNPKGLKLAPPRYAESNTDYKDAQASTLIAARSIFPDVDSFLASGKLHAQLAKCALLAHATPRGLAGFAQQGKEQEALINTLLNDEALMKQIMEMGGAYEGKYGQSLQIYSAIQKASERARDGFLQRLALGCALEHPDGNVKEEGKTAVELMVAMYLNYEQAYLDGDLDPAFDSYADWEYRFIFPHRSVEDVSWLRQTMRNYRPDHIVLKDYKWRYVRIVKTDIPYTSNVKRPVRPDLGLSRIQDYFLEGGICGPRAFIGKLATASFGIPTRGARQTGHAAMSHWTPDGWTTVLGAHWTFNRWRGRCGLDFLLETKARKRPEDYIKVLRAQWLGAAFGEAPVHGMNYGTGGGLWNALAFYRKLAIVEDAAIAEVALTGAELAESNDEAAEEAIAQIEMSEADKTIVIGEDGVITVPVAACSSPVSTEKVRYMKNFDGGIQVHYNLAGNRPELLKYTVQSPAAGKYELTANVVTVAINGGFLLRLNRRTMVDVEVPFTLGKWEHTKPVAIDLKEGRNSLQFTLQTPNKGLTIKEFTLTPVK
jgi:hypothetical protein